MTHTQTGLLAACAPNPAFPETLHGGREVHLYGPWALRALLRGLCSPAPGPPGVGPSLPCQGPQAVTLGEESLSCESKACWVVLEN